METKIKIKKYTEEEDEDEEDYSIDIEFTFSIVEYNFKTIIAICEANLCPRHDWISLYNGEKRILEFCNSNGNVFIKSYKNKEHISMLKFEVAKYGAGGDGCITINVPLENCKEAINKYILFTA